MIEEGREFDPRHLGKTVGELFAMCNHVEELEDLVDRCARAAILDFVKPALHWLVRFPAFQEFDDESADRGDPIESSNFLDQFFWARSHDSFVFWQDEFWRVIREACENVLQPASGWNDLTFDLIAAAASRDADGLCIRDFEKWAEDVLYDELRALLLDGDMDTVRGWGTRDSGEGDEQEEAS
jgi:hypothetical protein